MSKKNDLTVVSFFTGNAIYERLSKKLIESCENWGIKHRVKGLPDSGSWVKNCNKKSNFLLQSLQHADDGSCIVWIDVDAEIIDYPISLLHTTCDFGIRAEPGKSTKSPAGREEIRLPQRWPQDLNPAWFNSGTIFLRKTQKTIDLCSRWVDISKKNPNWWDQWSLQEAWAETQPRTWFFPASYCQIDVLHGTRGAVILHKLASAITDAKRSD
jgi:hypothetical protein